MICVWSRALQLTPSRLFQMPVLCAHQVRTDIKMDQWSAFGRAHFSWPQAGFFKCQYYVLTKPEPTSKWTNDLRLVARTSVDLKQAFPSARIHDWNVCAYTKIVKLWKFLKRISMIFETVKPEEASFVFSTKSTQSLWPILSCNLCFPPAFLHFYFLPPLKRNGFFSVLAAIIRGNSDKQPC